MGSVFGKLFKISTWGESHGRAVGVVIDGCPSGVSLNEDEINLELERRKPGQSRIVTPRKEDDLCDILSGVFEGKTTGTPISIIVKNKDQRSSDYSDVKTKYRPSHADFTYDQKYGFRDYRGGGRSSARETIGRVASGVVAKKVLDSKSDLDTEVLAYVKQVGTLKASIESKDINTDRIESNIVRCPDDVIAQKMIEIITQAKKEGNSLGGIIECIVRRPPIGLGEPVFDRLEADLAKAMMSIPATKGFEIGSGFSGASQFGSDHNDEFFKDESGKIRTKTNNSGGVQGGISNGEDIIFRVAFKPTATIMFSQNTVDNSGNETILKNKGRHDPCVLPRAVPIIEAMTNLVLCDHYLRHLYQCN